MTDAISTPESRFDYAVNIVLGHEGGYSNDPDDPGGETNYGITENDLKEHMKDFPSFPSDVKDLTRIEAGYFYKTVYWDEYNYDAINSLSIATKIFDMAVNLGPNEAHILVQRSLNYCGHDEIAVDGILGKQTIAAINALTSNDQQQELMDYIINNQKLFYEHLVQAKPILQKFLNGWLNRAAYAGA